MAGSLETGGLLLTRFRGAPFEKDSVAGFQVSRGSGRSSDIVAIMPTLLILNRSQLERVVDLFGRLIWDVNIQARAVSPQPCGAPREMRQGRSASCQPFNFTNAIIDFDLLNNRTISCLRARKGAARQISQTRSCRFFFSTICHASTLSYNFASLAIAPVQLAAKAPASKLGSPDIV